MFHRQPGQGQSAAQIADVFDRATGVGTVVSVFRSMLASSPAEADNLQQGVELARETINNGNALAKLEQLVELSKSFV